MRGTLQIGALQSTASARLPDVLKVYAARHAQVDIAVETGTSAELIGKVIESRLDGAFVSGVEDHPELDVVTSFVEELVIITPAAYRTVRAYLKQSTLPKPLVFKTGCHYRHRLERYLGGEGVGVLRPMEFETIDGIIGCVAAGLGDLTAPAIGRGALGAAEGGRDSRAGQAASVRGDAVRHASGADALAGGGAADRRDHR